VLDLRTVWAQVAEWTMVVTQCAVPSLPTVLVIEGHSVISDALVVALRSFGIRDVLCIDPVTIDAETVVKVSGRCSVVLVGLLVGDGRTTLTLIRSIAQRKTKVLAITSDQGTALAGAALRAGAEAVVHKDMPLRRLVHAIRALHEGQPMLTAEERQALLDALPDDPAEQRLLAPFEALTTREATVLRRLVAGDSPKSVALSEGVSIHTVRKHIHGVLTKLNVQSQREALAVARHAGWPSDPSPRGPHLVPISNGRPVSQHHHEQ
jgi:two-component system nitrate/nitrite response regulator NarL